MAQVHMIKAAVFGIGVSKTTHTARQHHTLEADVISATNTGTKTKTKCTRPQLQSASIWCTLQSPLSRVQTSIGQRNFAL